MSLTTRRVSGSIRDTVDHVLLPTHTAPSPTAIPNGRLPTVIVSGRATPGRITETVASSEFATQSAPKPNAATSGSVPTRIESSTRPLLRSILPTEFTSRSTTHSDPPPTATPMARDRTRNRLVSVTLRGSICQTNGASQPDAYTFPRSSSVRNPTDGRRPIVCV